jgi:hypothetical protein
MKIGTNLPKEKKFALKGIGFQLQLPSLGLGEITPSYILHTRAFGTYLLGGLFALQKNYKVMVFYM